MGQQQSQSKMQFKEHLEHLGIDEMYHTSLGELSDFNVKYLVHVGAEDIGQRCKIPIAAAKGIIEQLQAGQQQSPRKGQFKGHLGALGIDDRYHTSLGELSDFNVKYLVHVEAREIEQRCNVPMAAATGIVEQLQAARELNIIAPSLKNSGFAFTDPISSRALSRVASETAVVMRRNFSDVTDVSTWTGGSPTRNSTVSEADHSIVAVCCQRPGISFENTAEFKVLRGMPFVNVLQEGPLSVANLSFHISSNSSCRTFHFVGDLHADHTRGCLNLTSSSPVECFSTSEQRDVLVGALTSTKARCVILNANIHHLYREALVNDIGNGLSSDGSRIHVVYWDCEPSALTNQHCSDMAEALLPIIASQGERFAENAVEQARRVLRANACPAKLAHKAFPTEARSFVPESVSFEKMLTIVRDSFSEQSLAIEKVLEAVDRIRNTEEHIDGIAICMCESGFFEDGERVFDTLDCGGLSSAFTKHAPRVDHTNFESLLRKRCQEGKGDRWTAESLEELGRELGLVPASPAEADAELNAELKAGLKRALCGQPKDGFLLTTLDGQVQHASVLVPYKSRLHIRTKDGTTSGTKHLHAVGIIEQLMREKFSGIALVLSDTGRITALLTDPCAASEQPRAFFISRRSSPTQTFVQALLRKAPVSLEQADDLAQLMLKETQKMGVARVYVHAVLMKLALQEGHRHCGSPSDDDAHVLDAFGGAVWKRSSLYVWMPVAKVKWALRLENLKLGANCFSHLEFAEGCALAFEVDMRLRSKVPMPPDDDSAAVFKGERTDPYNSCVYSFEELQVELCQEGFSVGEVVEYWANDCKLKTIESSRVPSLATTCSSDGQPDS